MSFRCFIQTQDPVPGTGASPVRYPACEWLGDHGGVDHFHPMNRFVCSWLTRDLSEFVRCDEVLNVIAQIQAGTRAQWFVDGDAFNVDLQADCVQFNQSNVGPDDMAYWNQPEGRFTLDEMYALLRMWRDFLATSEEFSARLNAP